jgi:hypothetical protein
VQGCRRALEGVDPVPPANAALVAANFVELAARKANEVAIILLNMSMTDVVSYGAIFNARTVAQPDGCAATAWRNLLAIYKPVTQAKRHELEQEFNKCVHYSLEKSVDEWFAELEKLRIQLHVDYNVIYDDNKMIQHILYNLNPHPYQTTILMLKREISVVARATAAGAGAPPAITLTYIKEELRQVQVTTRGDKKFHKQENILITTQRGASNGKHRKGKKNFHKQFKGLCNTCGKQGHKGIDCPDRTKKADQAHVTQQQFDRTIPCPYCQIPGHTEDRCWKKEKDLKAQKKGKLEEKAEVAFSLITCFHPGKGEKFIGRNTQNICFIHTTLPRPAMSLSALRQREGILTPDTFIADSGATCHMRNSTKGMFDMKTHTMPIMVGNSDVIMSQKIGKYKGLVVQKDGQTSEIVLQDVLYVPELWTNLLSITKAIENPNIELSISKGIMS